MSLLLSIAASLAANAPDQGPQCQAAALAASLGAGMRPNELRRAIEAAQAHPLGSRENPVRVCDPTGERAHLARLRCADGSRPRVGQRGSIGMGPYRTILDLYPLDCGSAAPGRVELIMDMYHAEAEAAAPPGFTIVD